MKLDWKGIAVIGGIAFVVYLITRRDVQKIASAVGTAVNPASPENLAYKTVSGVTPAKSLGSALYDWLHPGDKG